MSQHFNADYENLTPNEIASQVVMLELTRQEVDDIVHILQRASKSDESGTADLARVIDSGERIYSPSSFENKLRYAICGEAQYHEDGENCWYSVSHDGVFYIATDTMALIDQVIADINKKEKK